MSDPVIIQVPAAPLYTVLTVLFSLFVGVVAGMSVTIIVRVWLDHINMQRTDWMVFLATTTVTSTVLFLFMSGMIQVQLIGGTA